MLKFNTSFKALIAFCLLLTVFIASYIEGLGRPVETIVEVNPNAEFYAQINELDALQQKQAKIDENLLAELNSGGYTFNDPLLVVDPYDSSPLTAIVLFKTTDSVSIKIHIEGKTSSTSIDYLIEEASTVHMIPIYGLYSNTLNQVTLTSINTQNEKIEKELMIQTEPLIEELSTNKLNVYKSNEEMSPGFTFSYESGNNRPFKAAFDENGDYRWFLSKEYTVMGNFNKGKSLFVTFGDAFGKTFIIEMNYLGKLLNVYFSPYGAHHDLEIEQDHLIVLGSNNYPNTIEDLVYQIDTTSGQITKTLDYKNIMIRTRFFGVLYSNMDWLHMNAVVENKGKLIVSCNYQSTILKNDWEGNIEWMLGDPRYYPTKYASYFLKPIGENFRYNYNQHAVEVLPDTDGDDDTIDIIVFDNGSSRNAVNDLLQQQIRYGAIEPPLSSRIVLYRINERNKTVEQLWEYGLQRPELFSKFRGDADLLENGNYLGLFSISTDDSGVLSHHTIYLEVTPDGKVAYEVVATSTNLENVYDDYRSERFEMYNTSSINLALGQVSNNFIPIDYLQKARDYLLTLGE